MYSLCHDVLGAIIEIVSGMNLGDYMRENIFLPLGMNNSSMKATDFEGNYPLTHNITDNGYVSDGGAAYRSFHFSRNYYSGGAGLVTTVEDYAIFADALASGGVGKNGNRII